MVQLLYDNASELASPLSTANWNFQFSYAG
jgi:hypothetical protein